MKKLRKHSVALACALTLALTASGCTSDEDTDPDDAQPTAPDPTPLEMDGIGEAVNVVYLADNGEEIHLSITAKEVTQGAQRDMDYLDEASQNLVNGMSPYYVTFEVAWSEPQLELVDGLSIVDALWPAYGNGRIGQKVLIEDGEFPNCSSVPISIPEEPEEDADPTLTHDFCIIGLVAEGESQSLVGGAFFQHGSPHEAVIWTP